MRITRLTCLTALIALLGLAVAAPATAFCPFCEAPSLTLSEQIAQSDAVLLVQWVKGTKRAKDTAARTVYEVVQVVRVPKKTKLKKGSRITLDRYRAGKKGDLFLLSGVQGNTIEWGSPLEVSETSFNYIVQSPSPETAPTKRLAYFVKFLEYPDPMIAGDAFAEFANTPYKDITPLTKTLPREKIRKWLQDDETLSTRLGLYGLLLGLCGDKSDAEVMRKKIVADSEDFRLGIDGVISGYLLLTGEEGLKVVEDSKFKDKEVPFSETYAGMQALRFMWRFGDGQIKKERLRESMRLLLDRPSLVDLVISDLARWKDWDIQKRLMDLYGAADYDTPTVKRSIVRYMLAATTDAPSGDAVKTPEHVTQAKKYLAVLRKKDPKTVKQAERFFRL